MNSVSGGVCSCGVNFSQTVVLGWPDPLAQGAELSKCDSDRDRHGAQLSTRVVRGELSYLAPLGSENISAPYFKQCFFQGEGYFPPRQSNTTPPSPKTEITNILFYILNFASIINFKM